MNCPGSIVRTVLAGVFLSVLTPIASLAQAEKALEQIRQRVSQRADTISRLQGEGVVREGANGLLQASGQLSEADDRVVKDENRDRSSAFALVAEQNGLTSSEVTEVFASGAAGRAAAPAPSAPASPAVPGPVQTTSTTAPAAVQTNAVPATSTAPSGSPSPTPSFPQTQLPQPPALDDSLPDKLINRPASSLYVDASDTSTRVQENMQGFGVFYIIGQSPGWYEVSTTEGGPSAGWLKDSESILWRHNLAVRFAHEARGNRLQVPFFGTAADVEAVLRLAEPERLAIGQSAAGNPDQKKAIDAGAVAVQPKLVSRNDFYVLPIVEHRSIMPGQLPSMRREARLLRVAALKGQSATPSSSAAASGATRLPMMDVVFVMDLTSSMGPFVQATVQAMRNFSKKLESAGAADSFRFGLWGYKDTKPDEDFGGGKVTENFTSSLQDRQAFLQTLQSVKVSRSGAGDWSEAVFYGVNDAINKTAWSPNAMRVIILVGDASSHDLSNQEKNPSRLNENTIRDLATQNNCYIMPIYIKADTPAAGEDFDKARPQFTMLGRNPNIGGSGAMAVIERGGSATQFESNLDSVFDNLVSDLQSAAKGEMSALLNTPAPENPSDMASLAQSIFRGAYLDWLGAQADQGEAIASELQGWACDKDLTNTDVQSLDVVFLISRSQLDTLKKSLDRIIDAGVRSRVRGTDFFSQIQSIVGQVAVNPSQLGSSPAAASISGFLQGLPYNSEVLSLSSEEWKSMPAQDQTALLDRLQARITYYETINADTTAWKALYDGDEPSSFVAAVPLDQLP